MKRFNLTLAVLCLATSLPAVARCQATELRRVVRAFDFEERRLGNREDLPMRWSKATGPGLPHYVNGTLATDDAHDGQFSFRFDLNGGSLIYRYDVGELRATRGAHYRVDSFVRTTVLPNARARLSAYFTDVDGHVLADTVRRGELYAATKAGEPWKLLRVELSAENPKAVWLVIELALLQPAQYAPPTLGERTLNVQDVRGSAWWDDITVSQVPRVAMSSDRPGNIFPRGTPPHLKVRVDDRFTEDLAAQLVVTNAAGKIVHQRSGALDMTLARPVGPGSVQTSLELPELPAGWYQASLVMSSQGQALEAQTIDLIQLPDDGRSVRPDRRFGFVATALPFDGWAELPQLLPMLSAGRVKLALWGPSGDIEQYDPAAFDNLLQSLGELGITPTGCLVDLPPALAARLSGGDVGGKDGRDVGGWGGGDAVDKKGGRPGPSSTLPLLLRADGADWKPQLAQLIARHANHLDRWQLGSDASDLFVTDPKMREVYAMVYGEFARLVQQPDLAMPWPAWYEMTGPLPATVALAVPSAVVLPSQLPLYVKDANAKNAAGLGAAPPAGGPNLSLTLDWLDREKYGRAAYLRDAAQRVIYALSSGAERIDLPLPFNVRRDGAGDDVAKQPQEMLLVLRTIISTLSGATYKGRVPIAEGVEAFLFDREGEGIMALWDRGTASGTRELALNLGRRPAVVDLWGNVTPLLPRAGSKRDGTGQVRLTLGQTPVFLVDIDGYLAQTRASFALDRPLIESSFKPHTRRVQFKNCYKTAIAGSLRLKPPAGWTLNPPSFQFSLNPGDTFDREISIEIPYNSVAGAKTIDAEFTLQGEADQAFHVPIAASLGLSDVGMTTLALLDGRDVVVQQMITNYGDKPIDYTAFALCPGQARQERMVTSLAAGQTTIKKYRFVGVTPTPEMKVRSGVKETAGTRILNEEVPVQ